MDRRHRLARGADFRRVRQEGGYWRGPLAILCARPNGQGRSRFGFVVSQEVGKAVVRNRIRRLLRETLRLRLECIEPGWDMVFIARREIAGANFRSVQEAVEKLLGEARLVKEEG